MPFQGSRSKTHHATTIRRDISADGQFNGIAGIAYARLQTSAYNTSFGKRYAAISTGTASCKWKISGLALLIQINHNQDATVSKVAPFSLRPENITDTRFTSC